MRPRVVHVVLGEGAMLVLQAYWNKFHADVHQRTMTGAGVISVEVLDRLPDSVRDLLFDDFEDDETPVVSVQIDVEFERCPTCDGAGLVQVEVSRAAAEKDSG